MIDAIVFLGIQGSGKGTQAKLLAAHTGFHHLNMGDLLREQSLIDTPLGREIKSIIDGGDLVSDSLVYRLIQQSLDPDCMGVIFDGFPRTMPQAEYLVEHYRLARVYYLDLAESEAIARIEGRRVCSQCGANYHLQSKAPSKRGVCDICGGLLITRADDSPIAIKERVKAFYKETFGLKSYFEQKGILVSVPANRPIEIIHNLILADIHWD
jgi:adenylate kinase